MMPNLATWMRAKDEKWFQPFFVKHPDIQVCDARKGDVSTDQMDGLLLTGGSDIAPEFLRQEVVDPTLIDKDADPVRDRWEFEAISKSLARGLPILGICRGIQILNVALGGTLKLDIPGHKHPDQKDCESSIRKSKQLAPSGGRSDCGRFRSRSVVRYRRHYRANAPAELSIRARGPISSRAGNNLRRVV
ncbi:MAG: hypothetical protein DME81_06520 [Verrucomicrobia bacterium]|nr:MAG: hypothetical protein DME81_06520 [Verrucomicrobiota bacterium]